jgi:hypothetical protein
MSNTRRGGAESPRRTREQRLRDALQSKPTALYLAGKGLTPEKLMGTPLPPDKMKQVAARRAAVSTARRPQPQRPVSLKPPDTGVVGDAILLTGGLGDVITLESFFPPELRRLVKIVYYATRAKGRVEELFRSLPGYRGVGGHVSVWDDYAALFAFMSKPEVASHVKRAGRPLPEKWGLVQDWSISRIFPLIHRGVLPYTGSSLLTGGLADISHFHLPDGYVVVCPYTINDKRMASRDFDRGDWDRLVARLERTGTPAVVVNQGTDPVPTHPLITDLSNRTTVPEAVEVVKQAKGYFGIDSAFSVVAAKLFDPPMLVVKSQNGHLASNTNVYFAPKTTHTYIRPRLEFDG